MCTADAATNNPAIASAVQNARAKAPAQSTPSAPRMSPRSPEFATMFRNSLLGFYGLSAAQTTTRQATPSPDTVVRVDSMNRGVTLLGK